MDKKNDNEHSQDKKNTILFCVFLGLAIILFVIVSIITEQYIKPVKTYINTHPIINIIGGALGYELGNMIYKKFIRKEK